MLSAKTNGTTPEMLGNITLENIARKRLMSYLKANSNFIDWERKDKVVYRQK